MSIKQAERRILEFQYPETGIGKLNFVAEPGVPEPDTLSCYLCHITNDDFPDDYFRSAGLPQSDLHVCLRCDSSYQHQTDQREAWLAEESEV